MEDKVEDIMDALDDYVSTRLAVEREGGDAWLLRRQLHDAADNLRAVLRSVISPLGEGDASMQQNGGSESGQ